MFDIVIAFLLIVSFLLICGGVAFLLFGTRAKIARHARRENSPREWLFVNAYGPQQARAGIPQTYGEALSFLKEHVGCSFVRVDLENAIIFFDGRKLAGQTDGK